MRIQKYYISYFILIDIKIRFWFITYFVRIFVCKNIFTQYVPINRQDLSYLQKMWIPKKQLDMKKKLSFSGWAQSSQIVVVDIQIVKINNRKDFVSCYIYSYIILLICKFQIYIKT